MPVVSESERFTYIGNTGSNLFLFSLIQIHLICYSILSGIHSIILFFFVHFLSLVCACWWYYVKQTMQHMLCKVFSLEKQTWYFNFRENLNAFIHLEHALTGDIVSRSFSWQTCSIEKMCHDTLYVSVAIFYGNA